MKLSGYFIRDQYKEISRVRILYRPLKSFNLSLKILDLKKSTKIDKFLSEMGSKFFGGLNQKSESISFLAI